MPAPTAQSGVATTTDHNALASYVDDTRTGVIARGERTTSSSTTTSEVAVLRLDDVVVKAGHLITVWTSDLALTSTVANDVVAARLRYTTDGSAATTSSTILGEGAALQPATIAQRLPVIIKYVPPTDQSLSILLSVARIGGTGNASLAIATNVPTIDLIVSDHGIDPGDTGVDL